MKLEISERLLFASATIEHRGNVIEIDRMLIDTGSGGTVFAADQLAQIHIVPEPEDKLRRIAGVGGAEYVFENVIHQLSVGPLSAMNFTVEIGALDYGFRINGIIGLDFLLTTNAVIDLFAMELRSR